MARTGSGFSSLADWKVHMRHDGREEWGRLESKTGRLSRECKLVKWYCSSLVVYQLTVLKTVVN